MAARARGSTRSLSPPCRSSAKKDEKDDGSSKKRRNSHSRSRSRSPRRTPSSSGKDEKKKEQNQEKPAVLHGLAAVVVNSTDARGYGYAAWKSSLDACPRAAHLLWEKVTKKVIPPAGYRLHPTESLPDTSGLEPCPTRGGDGWCSCHTVDLSVREIYTPLPASTITSILRVIQDRDAAMDNAWCECASNKGVDYVKFEFHPVASGGAK